MRDSNYVVHKIKIALLIGLKKLTINKYAEKYLSSSQENWLSHSKHLFEHQYLRRDE